MTESAVKHSQNRVFFTQAYINFEGSEQTNGKLIEKGLIMMQVHVSHSGSDVDQSLTAPPWLNPRYTDLVLRSAGQCSVLSQRLGFSTYRDDTIHWQNVLTFFITAWITVPVITLLYTWIHVLGNNLVPIRCFLHRNVGTKNGHSDRCEIPRMTSCHLSRMRNTRCLCPGQYRLFRFIRTQAYTVIITSFWLNFMFE